MNKNLFSFIVYYIDKKTRSRKSLVINAVSAFVAKQAA
jgi:hypothetical protein